MSYLRQVLANIFWPIKDGSDHDAALWTASLASLVMDERHTVEKRWFGGRYRWVITSPYAVYYRGKAVEVHDKWREPYVPEGKWANPNDRWNTLA